VEGQALRYYKTLIMLIRDNEDDLYKYEESTTNSWRHFSVNRFHSNFEHPL
jgi:hypothetical protein